MHQYTPDTPASLFPEMDNQHVKRCTRCSVEKPHSDFSSRKIKGKPYIVSICRACHSNYQRQKLAERNANNPDYKSRLVPIVDDKRKCARCHKDKPVSEYYFRVNRGSKNVYPYCKTCSAAYARERHARLNADNPNYKPARVPIIDGKRRCANCEQMKPVEDYGLVKDKKGTGTTTLRPYCNSCRRKIAVENAAKIRNDPERAAEQKAKIRERRLLKKFGLTSEDYNRMINAQLGVCAICKSPPPAGMCLVVDHNHSTGKIRGLLCNLCNTGIGALKDNIAILIAAKNYVEMDGVTS